MQVEHVTEDDGAAVHRFQRADEELAAEQENRVQRADAAGRHDAGVGVVAVVGALAGADVEGGGAVAGLEDAAVGGLEPGAGGHEGRQSSDRIRLRQPDGRTRGRGWSVRRRHASVRA